MKAKLSTLVVAEWAVELRSLDMFMVSRYRQAMRIGAQFPALIVDKQTREIISGNHRYTAALEEYGEDHLIDVTIKMATRKCRRCGHEWILRRMAEPVRCPKCGSPYWMKERERVKK